MSVRTISKVNSMSVLKQTAEQLGNHFFSPATLSFFDSRIGSTVYSVSDTIGYFTTSERSDPSMPRLYTVHRFEVVESTREDGRTTERLHINTFGGFQDYESAPSANKAAREAANVEKYNAL